MRLDRLAAFGLGLAVIVSAVGPGYSLAATPSSGTIGPANPRVDWDGPHEAFSDNSSTDCDGTVAKCDEFQFTVDVAPSYWDSHTGGIRVEISWPDATDKFEIWVYDGQGTRVAVEGAGDTEVITSVAVVVPEAAGTYTAITKYHKVVDSGYHGVATFESVSSTGKKGDGAFFLSAPLSFAPATVVSPHFLGSEPMLAMERPLSVTPSGVLDSDRIFVDWPLDFRNQIGQLHRSTDGGDSFRLVFDPTCPTRSRPTCQTAGGGDSDSEVSPFDGTVYFADQQAVVAQEAISSSIDHGDSFPADRQFAVSNSTTAADRQWVAAADPQVFQVGARPIHAFFSYGLFGIHAFVQGIDEAGAPIPQPAPQIQNVTRTGPIKVDVSGGKGHGWIYVPYIRGDLGDSLAVAVVHSSNYQDPTAWRSFKVSNDTPAIFPWLTLDSEGNAYATWVEKGIVYYSASDIDDPVNDPTNGGTPGTRWTPQLRVTAPTVGSSVFPEIVAGDPGRIAIAYDGSEDFEGPSTVAPASAKWDTYVAVVTDALGPQGQPVVQTGRVSHRPIHVGSIECSGGQTDCSGDAPDTALLDMIDIGLDADGRVGVVFADNHNELARFTTTNTLGGFTTGKPFSHFAKQTSGPSLLLPNGTIAITPPLNRVADLGGDATWPNVAEATSLPALDVKDVSLSLDGQDLVTRVDLSETTVDAMTRDLGAYNDEAPPTQQAGRLQYVLRFSSPSEIFHMSMESLEDGERRFFGGRLDANDRMDNGFGQVIGAAYKTDDAYPVTGEVKDGEIVMRAPASAFGLKTDDELYSVTAFAMAGPTEEDEVDALNPMRTVDASPPFDAILTGPPAPGLDCVPETSSGSIGSARLITCTARNADNDPVSNTKIAIEATGANDPDSADSATSADLACTTDSTGSCAITHGPGGIGTTTAPGDTIYRAWIDSDGNASTVEADAAESRDESTQPGDAPEPDGTDVVQAQAVDAPSLLVVTPEEVDREPEGAATITATVTDSNGAPVAGAPVSWSMSGVGQIVSSDVSTDSSGIATAVAVSGEQGLQFVTAATEPCSATGDCSATSTVRWGIEGCDVVGTSGPDLLEGTDVGETICGLGGDDVIIGNGGDDVLIGSTGDDTLVGGAGSDMLHGGRGSDGLQGGENGDVMNGGSGDDTIRGGGGADIARGGSGVDQIYGGPGKDECATGPQKRDEEFSCE